MARGVTWRSPRLYAGCSGFQGNASATCDAGAAMMVANRATYREHADMKKDAGKEPVAVTPIAFVKAISIAYDRRGLSFSPALEAARIVPELLERPQARVTAQQFEALSAHAMRELDDEALGWFSRRLPWGSHGLLCHACVNAPTLEVALKRWCRSHAILTDDVRLVLEKNTDVARVSIRIHALCESLREFCLVSLLRMVHGVACWLIDSRIPVRALTFPFPQPAHAASYRAMFPGPAHFDADEAGFSFDARYLALSPVRDEAATRVMLQKALQLTVLQYRRDRLLVEQVRMLFKARMSARQQPGLPNAEDVAAALNLSTRSLHRQLQEEGASLQLIKDEVRRERAIELIRRSARPVKQIAGLAGFANEKSFSRAFRQWTGMSPQEMRLAGQQN